MKLGKRILSALLTLCMVLIWAPIGASAVAEDLENLEIHRAAALGFSTDKLEQATVTGQEMTYLLDHLVKTEDPEKLVQWQSTYPNFREGDAPISRYDGMVALYTAAELLGQDFLNNDNWYTIHTTIGETCWDSIYWNDVYFGADAERPAMEWTLCPSAYFYSYGRLSMFSGSMLFDYDPESNSMRTDENLTYREALLAVVRMYDSIEDNLPVEREPTELDERILANAQETYEQILNTESDWTLGEGGTVYYVSPNGNDSNDGLTPETAWQTLGKVNSAALEDMEYPDYVFQDGGFPEYDWAAENRDSWADLDPGDVVLFERGGTWRGMLRTKEGVTYSAYGEGPKPEIWGSPENGSGSEKWSLLEGTDNIWVFYKELQDCGGILLGEDTVAQKKMAFWDDDTRTYLDVGNNQQFSSEVLESAEVLDLTKLEDLQFFNYIAYKNPVQNLAPEFGAYGTLYLRCDAGNPGDVYDSIEFFTGNNSWNENLVRAANNVTLDNLSFRYGSSGIQMQGSANTTVQNCCVAWMGGITLAYEIHIDGVTFSRTGASIMRTGEAILAGGTGNTVRNNYITQSFDWGISVEEYAGSWTDGTAECPRRDVTLADNLIEYCSGGIIVIDWYAWEYCVDAPTFTDVTIEGNQILYSSMNGWAHLEDYDSGSTYLAALYLGLNPGCSGIAVRNNTFYISSEISQLISLNVFETGPDVFTFSGNTYVQNNISKYLGFSQHTALGDTQYSVEYQSVAATAGAKEQLVELLGDQDAIVADPSFSGIGQLHHTEGTPVKENEVPATCQAGGSYDEVVYCSVCKTELSRHTVTTEKLAHTPGEAVRENEKAATCTTEGSYDLVVRCTECDEELSRESWTTDKLAHTEAEPVRENEKAATCTEAGSYDEVVYCDLCDEELSRKTVTVDALGHKDEDSDHKCDTCEKAISECVDENKDYKCDICGAELEKPEEPETDEVIRLAGAHRWETAIKVADEMKANLGVEKFDTIIIASGNDFADALAGSYLSTVKSAPILLSWGQGGKYAYLDEDNIAYIKANLAEGGTVYILGGEKAVPASYEEALKDYNVERLGGANRFETNLLILAEAGVNKGDEILVCTSTNFADSLSASATGMPILLVFNNYKALYGEQPEYLATLEDCTFTIVGGESAVCAELETAIKTYGETTRLAGENRFETSVMVAEAYFEASETAVLAYAWNYPDGLCGGALAYSMDAPLILTMTKYEAEAVAYATENTITSGVVLGGDGLISDDAVRSIFAMDVEDEIIVK